MPEHFRTVRSRQNLYFPDRAASPLRTFSSGPEYGEYNSFLLPMQEDLLKFDVAQNTWAGLWEITP
jgi:hypothetical protein